jgi:CRISPR/Cas system CSM-associated protein Csm3 (group 7 of RAMP superfamily)
MTKRYIAHIVLEADTPLKVGSNASDFLQDAPIQKDWNGLPMILGTSIAGVLRKDFTGDKNDIFGQDNGSKVIISNALLCINNKNEVCESLLPQKTDFLRIFDNLPIREHTAINSKGVTEKGAKFDEEVVYKGTRFKFSIEFIEEQKETFAEILNLLGNPAFRLGGGSTKGFGKFRVVEIKTAHLGLDEYTSSLNALLGHCEEFTTKQSVSQAHTIYTLKIKPDDFFIFGSGFGDGDADMTPVCEQVVDYANSKQSNKQILIPASSIKGAVAHRTTFHLNKLKGKTIEAKNGIESVREIFGEAKNSKLEIDGSKGKILISDCFKSFNEEKQTKTFDHVSIDRFTGGTIDGALFQEKTIVDDREYEIEILLENSIQGDELEAFEKSLDDICSGMLPLGGATTKGHGIFTGNWSKK